MRIGVGLSIPELAMRGGRAFSPLSLFAASEQGVWYDPYDFSSMFQDAAGTIPVTAVGDPVGKILDKSGNGNHATQATDTKRPLLGETGGKYYLTLDGTDDALATGNINFSATNSMSVFAGLYKATDALRGIVCELSADINTNNGAFNMAFPAALPATNRVGSASKGTVAVGVNITDAGYAAPKYAVLSSLSTIGTDSLVLRGNGAVLGSDATDQGTGNYGAAYPLHIGMRGGATIPFNGRIYSLIVRGAASTAGEIAATEAWVNAKTGAY